MTFKRFREHENVRDYQNKFFFLFYDICRITSIHRSSVNTKTLIRFVDDNRMLRKNKSVEKTVSIFFFFLEHK